MSVEMPPGAEVDTHGPHHQTGHRWLDIILAVSAVFISLVSLFLAVQHGRVMERMVEASTWAFVTADFSNSDRNFQPHTRLSLKNEGVGPAKVESLEVFYNGVAQPGPRALVNAILKRPEPERSGRLLVSDTHGVVLSSKEEWVFLDFNVGRFSDEEYSALARAGTNLSFRVCYCSVLDECSIVDTRKHAREPVPVKACPVISTPYESQK